MRWTGFLLLAALGSGALTHAQGVNDPARTPTESAEKMRFDVASIRISEPGKFTPPSFALSADAWFSDPNGRFHADFPLPVLITFAYKLWQTGEEERVMLAGLPKWVEDQNFTIQATAPLHATKDQYRLMMQTLLAERFGLKVHFEDREMPVLAMELEKAGKPGPKLVPHEKGLPCDAKPTADVFPRECYSNAAEPKGALWLAGSRATTMDLLGKFLGSVGGEKGELSRPVVDRTGLTGLWDFTLLYAAAEAGEDHKASEGETQGPSVLEAVHEQLGLKLKPTRATVPVLVIDHIQRPSEN